MNKLLLWILAICQLLDGLLTYIGINHFQGFHVEGNPLIRYLMSISSGFFGLLAVKSVALFILFIWAQVYRKFPPKGVSKALLFLTCVYLFAVILWLYVLSEECGINMCIAAII